MSCSFAVQAALIRRSIEGGAYYVSSSLLSTATWIRSLGRAPAQALHHRMETRNALAGRGRLARMRGWGGEVEYVRHAARFVGEREGGKEVEVEVGWTTAPERLGDGVPRWLDE